MNETFRKHVERLHPTFEVLIGNPPTPFGALTKAAAVSGIYLLSEGEQNLYIGRSRDIRARMRMHVGHYAGASFAVKLAREATKRKATYKTDGSTKELMKDSIFATAFENAKERIRRMQVRYVQEPDCNRQALLEIYATLALGTKYNDFETH